jgi:hypothetical protein
MMPTPATEQQETGFDWSKAVAVTAPLSTAAVAPGTQSAPGATDTDFDWSNAKSPTSSVPLTPPTGTAPAAPSAWDRFSTAFEKGVGIAPPQNGTEAIVYHATGGTGAGLVAYRAAKGLVDAVENAVKAKKPEEFEQAKRDVQQAVTDFHSGNYRNLASSVGNVAGDVIAGAGGPIASQVGKRIRSISEGARPGGDVATPLGETAADVANIGVASAVGGMGSAEAAPEAAPETAGPKEATVARNTAKSGISAGTPETTVPTGEDIQPNLQQGTRDIINKTLQKNALEPVPDNVTIRNAADNMSKQFTARSKGAFARVEELTNVNPTALKDVMASRADQIEAATAAGEMEKAGNLQQLQLRDEERMLQAFKQAKAIDPNADIDQARQDWNFSLRAEELSSAIRGSAEGTLKSPTLNPSKLTPRLQKLTEGRLPELMGDDSTTLAEHAENARDATQAIKDFEPQSATGQQALSKIISDNTVEQSSSIKGGKVVASTNWNGVVRDIGNLTPEGQKAFGTELAQVRQFAGKQALKQNAVSLLKKGVLAGAAGATGLVGYEAAKTAMGR